MKHPHMSLKATHMKRFALLAALGLAACSDKPVGQSEYFDPWQNPQLSGAPTPQQSPDMIAINQQLDERRLENAARNGDAALVASLEAAIATAGNDARASGQTQIAPAPTTAQQVATTTPQAALTTSQVQTAEIAGTGEISDNSFSSVVQKETIETDAARLAALSQAKIVLQAEPLPERTDGVNLAAFARSTSHNIGQRLFSRSSRASASQRCRKYGNADAAQRAFLIAGGPENDELKLDPDGDGFVCGWSPMPFRNLRVGG